MSTVPALPQMSITRQANAYLLIMRLQSRAEAEMTYLRAIDPGLASRVERIAANVPELASRARHAGLLVVAGAVSLAGPGEVLACAGRYHRTAAVVARVRANNADAEFVLTRGEFGLIYCNCPDAQGLENGHGAPTSWVASRTCAHVLAAALVAS